MRRFSLLTATALWLVLGCSAQAASFDCAKVETKVEKIVCADTQLSKLDEDLAAAYAKTLQENGKVESVRRAQKQWIQERNACMDAQCVKNSYSTRRLSLISAATSKQVVVEKFPAASRITKTSNPKICAAVADTLQRSSKPTPQSYEDPLYVASIETGGRTYSYQNVDLDNDGTPDEVEQSCGSPSDGTCSLYVKLSSGGGYKVDDEIFHVVRFGSKYYVLVGHPSAMKNHRRRMYALSANGAKLVCNSF